MGKYDEFLRNQLSDRWPLLGSELAGALIEHWSVEPDNARKILQRATRQGIIMSSSPLTFGKGQFLYLKPGMYFGMEIVKDASRFTRKPLYRLLEVLDEIKVLSFYEGLKITASPDEQGSSKISMLIDIANHLEKLGIVTLSNDRRGEYYIQTKGALPAILRQLITNESVLDAHYQAMKLDAAFLPDVLRWLKKINLIDIGLAYRNISSPGTGVKHNEVMWDAYAYTKTTGINPSRASEADTVEKQTLVVIDILISRKYLQADLDGFLARVQVNLNSVKNGERKAMPIVVYHEIDDLTLNSMKMLGFLAVDIKTIFGSNISSVITNYKVILKGQSEMISEEIGAALQVIEDSGHIDQLRALRGVLFESLMYPVIKRFYPNAQVYQGKSLTDPKNNKQREFDLILISSHPDEIILAEFKGYTGRSYINLGASDTKDTLKYFMRGSLQVAHNHYKDNPDFKNHLIKAVYMTTGKFHSDTSDFMKKVKDGGHKASYIDMFFDGQDLESFLVQKGFKHEAKIIQKYFPQPLDGE